MLSKCNVDLLREIFSFLTATDFKSLTALSKQFNQDNLHIIHFYWKTLIAQSWHLPLSIVTSIKALDDENLKTICEYAQPVLNDILYDVDNFICDHDNNKITFAGQVGLANRSVQCAQPFPVACKKSVTINMLENMSEMLTALLFEFIHCMEEQMKMKINVKLKLMSVLKYNSRSYHSSPFAYYDTKRTLRQYYKPRLVSYYEVAIIANEASLRSESLFNTEENPTVFTNNECIAVGLATIEFRKEKKLPGWDNNSYGYHSDDGAIFHGKGKKLSAFGPTFGPGDIVGCGMNLYENSIFFTLNGLMLGTGFNSVVGTTQFGSSTGSNAFNNVNTNANGNVNNNTTQANAQPGNLFATNNTAATTHGSNHITANIHTNTNNSDASSHSSSKQGSEQVVLYPTVGIDANVSVVFNFGKEPFAFDLKQYIETQEKNLVLV